MEWINPKTIIGPPAEGEKYLKRPEINKQFWNAINNGEHILFTAPRRVGKSSVMKDLVKDAPEGIIVIYQDVESDRSSAEFYMRLWSLIVNELGGFTQWASRIGEWLGKRKIGEITLEGTIKIESDELNYKKELLDLIEELGKHADTVVLMLDEFPDVVNNVRKNEGDHAAIELLHVMRAIRHEEKFKRFKLVLAGSIGLEHVITSMDRIKLINDLRRIPVEALNEVEVDHLFALMLTGASIDIDDSCRTYIKRKVKHWLPFFFQLMIAKCNEIARKRMDTIITHDDIDTAFEMVLNEHEHFSDWETRLRDYLAPEDYKYCIGLLTQCAHRDVLLQQAYDYSKKTRPTSGYKSLLDDVLVKDGYLVLHGNNIFFLSPFLQQWWKSRHPEFEIEN